jgi:hypothetical protein
VPRNYPHPHPHWEGGVNWGLKLAAAAKNGNVSSEFYIFTSLHYFSIAQGLGNDI